MLLKKSRSYIEVGSLGGQPVFSCQQSDFIRKKLLLFLCYGANSFGEPCDVIKYSPEKLFRSRHFIWTQSYCNFLTWTHSDRPFSWCQVTGRYQIASRPSVTVTSLSARTAQSREQVPPWNTSSSTYNDRYSQLYNLFIISMGWHFVIMFT
jgi:hypothetical protein